MRLPLRAAFCFMAAAASAAAPDAELAGDPKWFQLGHYERSGDSWQSTIHAGEFFLAANGHVDPIAELAATVVALNAAPTADPEHHAQCRFPARLLWLRQRLRGQVNFRSDIQCPGFGAWTRSGSVESVSVVLASGFLGNPASYYGHTLLKFNYSDSVTQTSLLDQSASFGAIDEGRRDNPFVYLVKSLFHRYDAGFSHIHFYFHDHHYGNEELRDMWEYRLDLSSPDRDLIVAHAWEVMGKRYTYEFFQGNCALRMAEIIELAEGVDIVPRHRPWIVPQALAAKLALADYDGRQLVSEIIHHPSRQSRFYQKYLALSALEKGELRHLVQGGTDEDYARLESLSVPSQQMVLDALLDYHQYVDNPIEKASLSARKHYSRALSGRFQLPPGETRIQQLKPSSPDRAHAPGWLQGGWAHNEATGDIWFVRARATYYDALDFDVSHVRFGSLVMGDLQLEFLDQRVRVNRFDLVRVESVKPGGTGLPGDRGAAWRIGAGVEQARLGCRNCLTSRLQGDLGYTWALPSHMMLGVYGGAAIQTASANQGWGFARTTATINLDLGQAVRARLEFEHRLPAGGVVNDYGVALAEVRWSPSRRHDVRLRYRHDRVDEVGIGVGSYW